MRSIALTIVASSAPPVRSALLHHLAHVRVPPRSAALLAGERVGSSAEGPATDAIRTALAAVVSHLARGEAGPGCYATDVARLVGLGPGLTPSGDDLLVALVAMSSRLVTGGLLQAASADRLASEVAKVPSGRTTAIAHHLMAEAAGGRFPEPLAEFVAALGDPGIDHASLSRLVDRLAGTGAHTGADWIAGAISLSRGCLAQGGDAWPIA